MSRVDADLKTTIPQSIAERYQIRPGAQLEWVPSGDIIHVLPVQGSPAELTPEERLRLFDDATERQRVRQDSLPSSTTTLTNRGWDREEIYSRGESR
jgi:hypothetical protein